MDTSAEACVRSVAERASLPALLAEVERFCDRRGIEGRGRHDLRLVVEEACTNVVAHAYPGGPPGPVVLRLRDARIDGRPAVEVVVEDRGVPFDPLSLPVPDRTGPLETVPIGGLGVHLIRRLSHSQRYRRDPQLGNVFIITLLLPPGRLSSASTPT